MQTSDWIDFGVQDGMIVLGVNLWVILILAALIVLGWIGPRVWRKVH